MKEDLSNLKIGDKVYSIQKGWGVVVDFNDAIIVRVSSTKYTFTLGGKYFTSDLNQSLFTFNPFEKINEFPKWMEVKKRGEEEWEKAYVIAYVFDAYLCFPNTKGYLFNSFYVNEVREIQPIKEFTMEELAKLAGVDVKDFRIKKE